MKVIIAGSRHLDSYEEVEQSIKRSGFTITEVCSGGARGVDRQGEIYATKHNISLRSFPAEWNKYRTAAGPIRNRQMAEYADALIALWDGESRGTKNMILEAYSRNLRIYVKDYKRDIEVFWNNLS